MGTVGAWIKISEGMVVMSAIGKINSKNILPNPEKICLGYLPTCEIFHITELSVSDLCR